MVEWDLEQDERHWGDEKHIKFPLTKETLKIKMKLLNKQGKGNKPNRAQPITDSELDIL
jgi:hypothetical protein